MSERTFPCQAFLLMPAMNIREITVVAEERSGWSQSKWLEQEGSGNTHQLGVKAFYSFDEAHAFGTAMLDAHEARLQKQQQNLTKRRANLLKAQAKHKRA